MKNPNMDIQYLQYSPGQWDRINAETIVETPVSLTINAEIWLTFMCTPVDLEAMAVGFLYNEGVIETIDEVASVRLCASGDNVDVWLHHDAKRPDQWRKTSGCTGGITSVEDEFENEIYLNSNGAVIQPEMVGQLINQLFEGQQLYRKTGGVHTSALSDGNRLYLLAEDIGRHNTLDKIAGRYLMENFQLPRRIILTTGRISSEMLQKSARLGASVVISRTAPSSLSIKKAERWGITLIGYARRNRFNVYTHPERILFDQIAMESIETNQEPIKS